MKLLKVFFSFGLIVLIAPAPLRAMDNPNVPWGREVVADGKYELYLAIASQNNAAVVSRLKDDPSIINGSIGINLDPSKTFLGHAINLCSPQMVQLLLEHGANPNLPMQETQLPLMMNCEGAFQLRARLSRNWATIEAERKRLEGFFERRVRITQLLLEYGADIDVQDKGGRTALMYLLGGGDHSLNSLHFEGQVFKDVNLMPLLSLVLDHGPRLNLVRDRPVYEGLVFVIKKDQTARDIALLHGNATAVNFLDHYVWGSGMSLKLTAARALLKACQQKDALEVQDIIDSMPPELKAKVMLIAPKQVKDKIKVESVQNTNNE